MATRVKDMPRNQQKAVFANMGDGGYLRRLESAEMYQKRARYLKQQHDLHEDYEEKIWRVWQNKHLTYRQKMSKVHELQEQAKTKLEKFRAQEKVLITRQIREDNMRKFKAQTDLSKESKEELKAGKGPPKEKVSFERGNIARAERDVIARGIEKKDGRVESAYAVATNIVKQGGKAKDREAVEKEFKEQKEMAKETKEHPTFPKKTIKQIVEDHEHKK